MFIHSLQYQWHNEFENHDGATVISRLQLPYIITEGYVNLRCVWQLGCPAELNLKSPKQEHPTEWVYANALQELLPDVVASGGLPDKIGVSCCAQFAISASLVHEKPKREYERLRKWIIDTSVDRIEAGLSGRVMEYSWHSMYTTR